MQENNKLKVNLRHLVHYMLAWIIYIDNYCDIYKALKKKNYKYLVRMYWIPSKLKYKNIKFIYRWYLTKK